MENIEDATTPQDRTALRHQLLENGYPPLPLRGKRCLIPEWSRITIDHAFIDAHKRNGADTNSGIRCANVVAIDNDCDDAAISAKVNEVIVRHLGPTRFRRIGRAPREILLYWTDVAIPKLRTARYGGQQIEILGKGCEFVSHGIHPDTQRPYEWPDLDPLTSDVVNCPASLRSSYSR